MRRLPLFALIGALAVFAAVFAAACGDDGDQEGAPGTETTTATDGGAQGGEITVYSGRSEELVGPIIERFEAATGITVHVRYGDTAEMAALILDEGDRSPADVFFGQDAGASGELARAGRFVELDDDLLDLVDPTFRSPDGRWVGLSGRARVVVYNTDRLNEDDLPDSILGFTDPAWRGRLGWAPSNGSFQAFVTALRVLEGEDGARTWLEGIIANQPGVYEKNTAIVEAVGRGEVDAGFVNHYYLYRFLAENPDFPAANKFYTGGDPGALVNVAGAGVLASSGAKSAAVRFVEFLLSAEAQEYFASETFELPLVEGVEKDPSLPDVDQFRLPEIDLNDLEDLDGTLRLLAQVGAL